MATSAPLDTAIEVVTPENIAFEYQLAGPFRRLPAYLIDFAIRIFCFVTIVILVMLAASYLGGLAGTDIFTALGVAAMLVLYFLQSWFYGIFFETYFNGRTPGKWICSLRVISDDGHPITGMQALLRNLLRAIDLMPATTLAALDPENLALAMIPVSTGMVGLVTMTLTRRLQRLGDLAAGTMVVVDERNWVVPVTRIDDARVAALATFIPPEYRVSPTMAKALAGYAERRPHIAPPRRREIAHSLGGPLIDRFGFRPDIDPDLLLCSLYYRTFLADPSADPPDLGPLAGFSPLAKDAPIAEDAPLAKESSLDENASLANDASDPSHRVVAAEEPQ